MKSDDQASLERNGREIFACLVDACIGVGQRESFAFQCKLLFSSLKAQVEKTIEESSCDGELVQIAEGETHHSEQDALEEAQLDLVGLLHETVSQQRKFKERVRVD